MTFSSRALLTLLGLVLLVLGYTANFGFYSPAAMGLVLAASVFVFAAALTPARELRFPVHAATVALYGPLSAGLILLLKQAVLTPLPLLAMVYGLMAALTGLVALLAHLAGLRAADPLRAGLVGVGLLFSLQALLTCQLRYAAPDRLWASVGILLACGLTLLVWLSFLAQPQPGRGWQIRLGALFALGLAVRGLAIAGSPEPIIDVNAWLQQAPRFLLLGRNPYAADYPSPYGTPAARAQGINDAPDPRPATYPPTAILTGLPAALLGTDVRWVNVLADLLAALLLILGTRGLARSDLGLLAAGLYLGLPRTPFMIEQAWFEPQMAALLGLVLWLGVKRPAAAGVALGALLGAKQYAVVALPILLRATRDRRLWLAAGVTVVALVLPFVLWGPADFWSIVVAKHMARPVVPHALTLLALAKQAWGLDVPPAVTWGLALALIALVTWRAPRRLSPAQGLWLGASILAMVLGHKQGFFNYFVLVAYLLLWGVSGSAKAEADEVGALP